MIAWGQPPSAVPRAQPGSRAFTSGAKSLAKYLKLVYYRPSGAFPFFGPLTNSFPAIK